MSDGKKRPQGLSPANASPGLFQRGRVGPPRRGPKKEQVMALVPSKLAAKVAFYVAHQDPWTLNGTALRIAPDDITQMQTLTDAAQAAQTAKESATDAARTANQLYRQAVAAMAAHGASIISTIRGTAQATGDPNIWNLAVLPEPKTREPVAAPGSPYAPAVQLIAGGSLQLKWKCKNPSDGPGVVYEIHRQSGDGTMSYLATSGTRSFIDSTLPAGTANVTYAITAVRSTKKGFPTQFAVQFGTDGGQSLPMIRKAA
jgi:hypothetical protein